MNIAQKLYNRQINGEFKDQKSNEWYIQRLKLLTASQISSVLNNNIYESSYELFTKKIYDLIMHNIDNNHIHNNYIHNKYTEWGNKFESVAIKFYEFIKKEKVKEIGLVPHPIYKWLGASPDGLILSGNLLEIKCPVKRKISGEIPLPYWIQMQIQMEVCNINNCDYLECSFYEYKNKDDYDKDDYDKDLKGIHKNNKDKIIYWKIENTFIKNISRDKEWFANNKMTLKLFNNSINKIKKEVYKKINTIKDFNYKLNLMNLIKETINDCNKKDDEYWMTDWNTFIPANKVKNYILDDPIIDYLEYISNNNNTNNMNELSTNNIILPKDSRINAFNQYLFNKGNIFETNVVNILKEKFGQKIVTISDNSYKIRSYKKYKETVEHIKKGTPIIYHGVLHDYEKCIYGIPDLIVRKDYLKLLTLDNITQTDIKNNIKNNDLSKKYVIVEIKFSKLHLCSDGIHITNSNNYMPYNKSQLYIYNKILGKIQNFESSKSYIIGKCWEYKKDNKLYKGEMFEKIGCVNFKKNDKYIRNKTSNAINWLRDLKDVNLLNNMKLFPPSRNELKPNMCRINDKWQKTKNIIATKTNDITQLWMCGIKNRNTAEKNKIHNWKTHINLKTKQLGISGGKENILQNLIDINQDVCKHDSKILPLKLNKKQKILINADKTIEIFIDFETINKLIVGNNSDFIFMIGIGYIIDNKWNFVCLVANDLSNLSEKKILIDFHDTINNIIYKNASNKRKINILDKKNIINYKLWHWGYAEIYLYTNAIKRHNLKNNKINLDKCCNLLNIFKEICIVSKGMLNFSLKSVVNSFYNNKFIQTSYNTEIDNGMDAMMYAYNKYKLLEDIDSKKVKNDFNEIIKYNEVDCKVMWEILVFLRNHYK